MINFLLLMLVPMGIALVTILWFKHNVTLQEFALQLAVPALCLASGLGIAYCQSTADVELWNGKVTSKQRVKESCEHSYECFCHQSCSGSGSNRSCHEVCQTCYEHSYDISWYVYASTNERIEISRVNRQGTTMPPRWAAVYVGEPFSSAHPYTNYILANPDSVLLGGKGDVERFKALLPPQYPPVYDYYKVQHVLNLGGVPLQQPQDWEWLLSEVNGDLGPSKQVNLILLFVKTADPKYALALKDWWIGGKKNDVLIVVGSLDGRKIEFVDVLSWTPKHIYKIRLKDAIYKIGNLDKRDEIVKAIRHYTQFDFERMHMKDYQYLARSFQPSNGAMLLLFVLGTLLSIGLAVFAVKNGIDCDWDEPKRYRSYQ